MADQKRWFKVWTSILHDPNFMDLPLESIGRWVMLGAWIAQQGKNGSLKTSENAFTTILRLDNGMITEMITNDNVLGLPNVQMKRDENDNGKIIVSFKNWNKYQMDSTGYERLKRWRSKQNDNGVREEKTKRRLREENKKKEEEEDLLDSSCAKPPVVAPAEARNNGHVAGRRKGENIAEEARLLATQLNLMILTNTPHATPASDRQLTTWAADIDKLHRIDGKTWEQITWLLSWSQKDPFWSANIQSGAKFRKQWNQLLAKASKEQPHYSPPVDPDYEDDFLRKRRAKEHGQ